MLVDVVFPIFAPSKEWTKAFEEMNYNSEKVEKEFGSPFVSNQHEDLKVRDGIYYTGLNSSNWFRDANLDVYSSFSSVHSESHKSWEYRKNHDMKFISLFDIADMYRMAMFGDARHVEYGVCDNEQQILDKWSHLENSKQRHFITMTPIHKDNQPEKDGWRWHKWGEYIGEHEIECEYLYDEKDIKVVYVFHIYTLTPESSLGSMPVKKVLQEA